MSGLTPLRKGWERVLSAWTRNDGKPKEEWAPGVDLKEAVLIGLLIVVVTVMIDLVVPGLIRRA
jgi:hypothetical protein